MEQLAGQLETVKGKKSYGYLPKSVKKTVDEVVDRLEELPVVKQCYDQWCILQSEVDSYYHDNPREKKKLSQEKEFRQIKNAIIQEAERIRLGEITFEDANLPAMTNQSKCRASLMPAGSCGRSFRMRASPWRTGTALRRSWSIWQSRATPMLNFGWDNSTGTALC